jgi:hypothetical protein
VAEFDRLSDAAALYEEDLEALWRELAAEDARFWVAKSRPQRLRLEALGEELEALEAAIFARPAGAADEAKLKLEIVARAINGGADADHIVSLFDRCRADLLRYNVSLL